MILVLWLSFCSIDQIICPSASPSLWLYHNLATQIVSRSLSFIFSNFRGLWLLFGSLFFHINCQILKTNLLGFCLDISIWGRADKLFEFLSSWRWYIFSFILVFTFCSLRLRHILNDHCWKSLLRKQKNFPPSKALFFCNLGKLEEIVLLRRFWWPQAMSTYYAHTSGDCKSSVHLY